MNDMLTLAVGNRGFSQVDFYDGLDLFVVANQAAELVAEARGVLDWEFEDNFVRSTIQHEAYTLVDASITSIGSHPDYRPTDPDFWERVIDGVSKAVGVPTEIMQASIAPAPIATPKELTELRLKLHSNGYHPVPVVGAHIDTPSAGKKPTMPGWQTKCLTAGPDEIEKWPRSQRNCTNTGVLCGEIVGVDIDVLDETLSAKVVAAAAQKFGLTSLRRIGRAPKVLFVYRVETPHEKLTTADLIFGDDHEDKNARAKVEILAQGQHFVAFGIHPDTRAPYIWPDKSPLDVATGDVPLVTRELLEQFVTEAEVILRTAGARTAKQIKESAKKQEKTTKKETKEQEKTAENREKQGNDAAGVGVGDSERPSREKIADALEHVVNDLDYRDWIKIGFALYDGLGDSGRDLWEAWSATYPGNDPRVTSEKWPTFAKGHSAKIATLFWFAQQNGWWWKDERKLPRGYSFSDRGLMWKNPDDADNPAMHIAGCFEVEAKTRNADGHGWGVLLRWQDQDGREHRFALAHDLLAGDGLEARRELVNRGFYIAPNAAARSKFNAFLLQVNSPSRALSTDRVGWNGTAFVLPDECFGGKPEETMLLQNSTSHEHLFRQAGTLEEWQEIPRLAVGNSRLILAISMAFAGPLLYPCSQEGGGVHLKGSSSIGKTTALHAAGSVWGSNGSNTGFTCSWRATSNGLEGVCVNYNDTLLPIDEMSQISGKDAGEAAYMMANGSGKSRSSRDGSARKSAKFRVLFLSSGEIGLADKVAEDGRGKKISAGQQVRIIDVPADAGAGLGLFENLHDLPSGKALSKRIVDAATTRTYGTAGRAFVAAIAPQLADIRDQAAKATAVFCEKYLPKDADGQVGRVAQRFALIAFAGELAISLGVVKTWEVGTAISAVGVCFEAWLHERGHRGAAEAHGGVEAVREFLQLHGMARFVDAWGEEEQVAEHEKWMRITQEAGTRPPLPPRHPIPQRDACGFRKKIDDDTGWEFYINDAGWAEMCTGFNPKTLAQTLIEMKALLPAYDTRGRVKRQVRIPGYGYSRYYVISATLLMEM